ncbi:Transcriptional regulator, TetR family [Microbacterium esteraromaticum]|uniref:Transcriptional regulator, TetR family n=1 Tax=Microbacterium esteraromaticum TaxID=57043 RepID=A0A1R4KF02_9MICO|nr:TetR/AcrR family transcriptional regulator [Microbacterium esteraromaticum]SJN42724.1 Transcriptional regulator, TetR family [Microbacterium esteraromaticum]
MQKTEKRPGGRASPMTIEQRREMIATAAIPLFIEQGSSVTTKQLADHLGIAEGTIFRAYGDKDALIRAVVDVFFDHANDTLVPEISTAGLSIEERLHAVIRHARGRAKGMFAMLSLLDPGEARQYMKRRPSGGFEETAAQIFTADAAQLQIPPRKLGALIRLLVIAASAPQLGDGAALSDEELVDFALYGIAGRPRRSTADDGKKN